MANSTASQYQIEKSDLEARATFFAAELARIQARLGEVNALLGVLAAPAPTATTVAPAAPVKERKKPGPKPKATAAAAPTPAPAAAPKRRGRPPGSKNKPKVAAAAPAPAPVKERKKPGRKPKALAAPAAAPAAPAAAPKPVAAAPAPVAAAPARRGRRSAVSAASIHDKGIVEAAVLLAKARNIRKADAGDVLQWFEEAGYKTRNGLPSRNSVYVSLNRESTEGGKKGRAKVKRTDRGAFEFDID